MQSLPISQDDARPLVEQIVCGIRDQIEQNRLLPGSRLPSIRRFAEAHGVSRFTVVEAYDRLVAMGYLTSRRGAGFYAAQTRRDRAIEQRDGASGHNEELVWLIQRLLQAEDDSLLAGGPWLPKDWLDEAGIRQSLNVLARKNGSYLLEYGDPFGYLPLREHLVVMLEELGIAARVPQILLTHGTSQALELVIRHMLRPGDTVLVDDPGYYNLFGNLRLNGIRMIGVPRLAEGPDVDALERAATEHRPKAFFTQSAMQNPTGSTMTPHVAFRVLQAAERHDFQIVEDDVFCDLQRQPTPRLATLDQLKRVIYVRSFSKTLSGSLRVGFVACRPELASQLADVKMLSSITSSQFAERLNYLMLVDGHYRKYLARLREQLDLARLAVERTFQRVGLELFMRPKEGMFAWARFPHVADSFVLARRAAETGFVLAPGRVFRPNLEPSPWLRFNIAVCADRRVERWLETLAAEPVSAT